MAMTFSNEGDEQSSKGRKINSRTREKVKRKRTEKDNGRDRGEKRLWEGERD